MAASLAILTGAALYLGIGCILATAFVIAGIPRAMPHAGSVTAGARILLLPGAALLWPLVLRRWIAPR